MKRQKTRAVSSQSALGMGVGQGVGDEHDLEGEGRNVLYCSIGPVNDPVAVLLTTPMKKRRRSVR